MDRRGQEPEDIVIAPPRWTAIAPFLGRTPGLTSRQWRLFGLIVIASIFNQYDVALLQLALSQIQESLGVAPAELSNIAALIKLGALPALFLTMAADRFGRRRLLLFTIVAYTVLTGATAFATNVTVFVLLQFFARLFITAEMLLAVVMITEEFPSGARGWGVGAFLALSSYGFALAALLFALVDLLPFGWRSLYFAGVVPLLVIAHLRRHMPETRRFLAQKELTRQSARGLLAPLRGLVQQYPGRLLAVAGIFFLVAVASEPAVFLDPTYLQTAHQWRPWHISLLTLGFGFIALFGSTVAGRIGDTIGRRQAISLFCTGLVITVVVFYNTGGWLLPLLWAAMLLSLRGMTVLLAAISAELFPTSARSTAAGIQSALGTVGAVVGLGLHAILTVELGSAWIAVSVMVLLLLPVPLILYYALPETRGRTLETIAPELYEAEISS